MKNWELFLIIVISIPCDFLFYQMGVIATQQSAIKAGVAEYNKTTGKIEWVTK